MELLCMLRAMVVSVQTEGTESAPNREYALIHVDEIRLIMRKYSMLYEYMLLSTYS